MGEAEAIAGEAAEPEEGRVSPGRRFAICLVAFVALMAYTLIGVAEERTDAVPAFIFQILTWAGLLGVAMHRHPLGQLRISDPLTVMLMVFLYYFVNPGVTWLHGAHIALSGPGTVLLTPELVARIQYMHIAFMVFFVGTYVLCVPSVNVRYVSLRQLHDELPSGLIAVAVGLAPIIVLVLERIVSKGALLPTHSYGDDWRSGAESLATAQRLGGGDQFIAQIFSKVYFVPVMMLGLGLGVTLARLFAQRRAFSLLAIAALCPLLMILAGGGRSGIALPFLMAVLVADALVGIRWRWIMLALFFGLSFFNAFAIYRGVQDRDFNEAIRTTREGLETTGRETSVSTEDSVMLVKEALMVEIVDRTNNYMGVDYVSQAVLSLLPQQIIPEKVRWDNTARMLSRELIGRAADDGTAGVAGSIVADGYSIGGDLGIILIAILMGVVYAGSVRLCLVSRKGSGTVPYIQFGLLLVYAPQAYNYVRSDLGQVLLQFIYNLALPLGAVFLMRGVVVGARWFFPLTIYRHGRGAQGA